MNKITILLLLICALSMAGYATSKPNPMRAWHAGEVMEAYVKTVSQGEPEWVEHLFMDDFEYYLHATNERYTKKHFVKNHLQAKLCFQIQNRIPLYCSIQFFEQLNLHLGLKYQDL